MSVDRVRSVADAIERVRLVRERASGKWSEADTETRAIEPILQALGYSSWEYSKRPASTGGYFPDYVISPEAKHKWFLEAKAWGESLESKADQAVNYANNDGAEWAVITNGHCWILYQATRKAPIQEKVVEVIHILEDADAAERLTALLSKEAMIANEPRRIARTAWLRQVLETELRNPSSGLVSALCKHVNVGYELHASKQEIAEALAQLLTTPKRDRPPLSVPALQARSSTRSVPPHLSPDPPGPSPEVPKREVTLRDLRSMSVTGMQPPRGIVLPGGRKLTCGRWKDLLVRLAEELCSTGRLTPPITSRGSRRYIVNWETVDRGGNQMYGPKAISIGSRTAYVETNLSARTVVEQAALLVELADISLDSVIVHW